MNILFLIFHGFSEISGITKKIYAQVDGLKENGHHVDLCYYTIDQDGYRKRMVNNEVIENYGKGKLAALKKRTRYNAIVKYILTHNIQIVYMRSDHNANPFTIHFIHKLKKHGIKTIMEIPTYPYDQEYKTFPWSTKIQAYVDRLFRYRLASQLFRIVTFSNYNQIFGRPTIQISNGIDFNNIPLKADAPMDTNVFQMIGVAEVHYWHAFDRAISGIGEYYKKEHHTDVYFHIVGGVCEEERKIHQTIIQKYHIEKQIIYHGQLFGTELNKIFDISNFAIASLGRHRSGITNIKTLKNREYAARGIPFIYSETDSDFENKPYILKAPADETPIDINRIIEFTKNLNISSIDIRNSVRSLSWSVQMQKVIEEIINQIP